MTMKNMTNVNAEVKRLERLISDMEWEDQDPRFEVQELDHYKKLQSRGEIWEPNF